MSCSLLSFLIFRPITGRAHFHDFGIKPTQHFDQIGLRGHHGVDVFINTRHLIESGRQKFHTTFC